MLHYTKLEFRCFSKAHQKYSRIIQLKGNTFLYKCLHLVETKSNFMLTMLCVPCWSTSAVPASGLFILYMLFILYHWERTSCCLAYFSLQSFRWFGWNVNTTRKFQTSRRKARRRGLADDWHIQSTHLDHRVGRRLSGLLCALLLEQRRGHETEATEELMSSGARGNTRGV